MIRPNLTYIYDMSDGDRVFEKKVIAIIKSEFPKEKQVYKNSIKAKKYLLAAQHVHKLKYKISILGLEKSYETAVAFENDLLDKCTKLQDEFESILSVISSYLREL